MYNPGKILLFLTSVLFAFCLSQLCSAQTAEKEKGSMQSVTGCVQKGDESGGFTLVADNGKVWELHGKKVSLPEHIGHTVTVTGSTENESQAEEEKIEAHEKKEYAEKEHGDLKVSS